MIQIKTFETSNDNIVNEFIKSNPNSKIIQTNPIIIQYESIDESDYIIPTHELHGKTYNLSFVLATDKPVDNEYKNRHLFSSASFFTSKILIFKDYIHFFTDEVYFYSNKKYKNFRCKFVEYNKIENCFYVNNEKVVCYVTNDIDDGNKFETKLHALDYHDDYYRFTNITNISKSFDNLEDLILTTFKDLFGFVENNIITYFNNKTQKHHIII